MAMALGAAACGSSDGDTAAPVSTVTEAEAEAPAAPEPSILELSAPAADGSTVNLSDYAGQDLMLWFWAPW